MSIWYNRGRVKADGTLKIMGYLIMNYSLHDLGPNFEGHWNSNCQICDKDVQLGERFYRKPEEISLHTESSYPIVHAICLEEIYNKE